MAMQALDNPLPAQTAAGATSVTELGEVPSTFAQATWTPSKLSLASPSLVTGVVTNNVTFNFRYVRAGTPAALGTLTLASGTNLAAEVETAVPVTYTGTLSPGDVIDVQMVQNGTGLAVPAGVLAKIEIE